MFGKSFLKSENAASFGAFLQLVRNDCTTTIILIKLDFGKWKWPGVQIRPLSLEAVSKMHFKAILFKMGRSLNALYTLWLFNLLLSIPLKASGGSGL